MKNFAKFYAVFLIVMIAFALNSCESSKKAKVPGQVVIPKDKTLVPDSKHYVVLLVDTENINNNNNAKDFCSFPGLGHKPPRDSIKNYTTDVLRGDSVIWLGVSTSAPEEHNVNIIRIIHQGGHQVLGPPGYAKGKAKGKIKTNAEIGQQETYKIQFRVIKDGITSEPYTIDPKILVH